MNELVEINSVIHSEAVDHFNSLYYRYFSGVEYDVFVMALIRNPFRISVEEFPNEQNEDEGIQEKFLGIVRDSTVKASFEDEKAWKVFGK